MNLEAQTFESFPLQSLYKAINGCAVRYPMDSFTELNMGD